jgi:cell wall assembly regulator SMI1
VLVLTEEKESHIISWRRMREPLPERMIRGAELLFGVSFPKDYREHLEIYHDASPHPSRFLVKDSPLGAFGGCFGVLLTLDPRSEENVFTYMGREAWPDGVIPIVQDGGGNLLCLDYRHDPQRLCPSVIYWIHELGDEGFFPLCPTFSDLIQSIGVDG